MSSPQMKAQCAIARAERDGTCAETRFRLSLKRTSPFKSVGASVQSTASSRGVRISVSSAGYTMFRGGMRVLATHSIRQFPLHVPSRVPPGSERALPTRPDYHLCLSQSESLHVSISAPEQPRLLPSWPGPLSRRKVPLSMNLPDHPLTDGLLGRVGPGIDSRWCHWIFQWHIPSDRTMALGSTQPIVKMSTRNISWG